MTTQSIIGVAIQVHGTKRSNWDIELQMRIVVLTFNYAVVGAAVLVHCIEMLKPDKELKVKQGSVKFPGTFR